MVSTEALLLKHYYRRQGAPKVAQSRFLGESQNWSKSFEAKMCHK